MNALALAQQLPPATGQNPLLLAVLFGLATLLPAVLLLGTSFVKCSIVFASLRNAFGAAELPGQLVTLGLSAVLSLHIMAPTLDAAWQSARAPALEALRRDPTTPAGLDALDQTWQAARAPVLRFLRDNSDPRDRALFVELATRARAQQQSPARVDPGSVTVLLPAFALSELTRAFVMAFLLLLPFLVLDLVVAQGLAAMGLSTLSASAVALPFKLALFVSADGWRVLARALVLGYH
ncbi:MAG: EscR/YscR/HrcR family type III secretion system export apparatus protein [Myxococcales bacterium]|nr:EscR/YscR/HrcR family type III secretion system export apparatus protein [Myxococcales bacterium]